MDMEYRGGAASQYPDIADSYPVRVEIPVNENPNKLYAIPIAGMAIKAIMIIPFLIAWYIVFAIVALASLVFWIPVLFTGAYPEAGYTLMGGFIRWTTRLSCFMFGLTDKYPSFSFDDVDNRGVTIRFERNGAANRFWAIPVIGILVKLVILIPHYLVLYVLGLVSGLLLYISWIPVLFTGRYPTWGYTLFGGTIRWTARFYAYLFGITDVYPPFSLS
ncbi:MAG: hypothetical protein JWO42_3453 [Chloroflexi bacterium]|jgi:hypothetical protein|nr:hypothetical protein [Chloroflexota bacterium]